MKYTIRNTQNGFLVRYDDKVRVFEYKAEDEMSKEKQEKSREAYVEAQLRMIEYLLERIVWEREVCPDHKLKLKIEWIV